MAGAYLRRTDDVALIGALWPALTRAIAWVEGQGDSNGDGLIDYKRGADTGLANQGWKDSEDSVFHADGRFPVGPDRAGGGAGLRLRRLPGDGRRWPGAWASPAPTGGAPAPRRSAGGSKQRFWMEDAGFYGIAIDGDGALCTPQASNAGHLLFAGLPSAERAGQRHPPAAVGRASTAAGGCARSPPARAGSIR